MTLRDRGRRNRHSAARFAAICLCALSAVASLAAESPYGGSLQVTGQRTGFFHTQQIGGRWWLIDPDGCGFFSTGCNHVGYTGDVSPALGYSTYQRTTERKYGSEDVWATAQAARLRDRGFNTVGAWSSGGMLRVGMPYTIMLGIGRASTSRKMTPEPGKGGVAWFWFPDVFDPDFAANCRKQARRCSELRDDPHLLGYFLDNEMAWGKMWTGPFHMPPDSPAKQALADFLRQELGGDQAALGQLLEGAQPPVRDFPDILQTTSPPKQPRGEIQDKWSRLVAERYFEATCGAVRQADPNHMILTERFAGPPPDYVLDVAGEYADVLCMNFYAFFTRPGVEKAFTKQVPDMSRRSGLPVMITEWAFLAADNAHPNSWGAGPRVATQVDRCAGFISYVAAALWAPEIVGCHWFEYVDEPRTGRFDGENGNYGIVTERDEAYPALTLAARAINGGKYALLADPSKSVEFLADPGMAAQVVHAGGLQINSQDIQPCRASVVRQGPQGVEVTLVGPGTGLTLPERLCGRPVTIDSDAEAVYLRFSATGAPTAASLAQGSFLQVGGTPLLELPHVAPRVELELVPEPRVAAGDRYSSVRVNGQNVPELADASGPWVLIPHKVLEPAEGPVSCPVIIRAGASSLGGRLRAEFAGEALVGDLPQVNLAPGQELECVLSLPFPKDRQHEPTLLRLWVEADDGSQVFYEQGVRAQ